MKSILFALTSLCFFVSAQAQTSHLVFAEGAAVARLTWLQGPRVSEESVLRLEWLDAGLSAIEAPGPVKVTLWMPDHGHGSSPTRIQQEIGLDGRPLAGVYRVSRMYFTMGGLWEVRVSLSRSVAPAETQVLSVNIEGHGHHHH